ncbi:GrdX family protein [Lutispora sp.]|uniref:GrdX family protein n=1 Tax=Lutispora sp. TaxID=2828727 RepID=UPI002B2111EC|nr:GrdX family protein [Lutispora sp.]MEA4960201.1 GrdX family protein [Lutispora sp.]
MISLTRNIYILTNNVLICDKFNDTLKVSYVDGSYIDVLYQVRDRIHTGSVLISHPLMGSVKPNETPYRSIILEDKKGALDFQSLSIIESSIESCKKLLNDRPTPDWSNKVLEDFRFLDMKLLESALSSLGINY